MLVRGLSGIKRHRRRAFSPAGPAYETIQNTGEAGFHRAAVEQAQDQLRDGLPLRAEINIAEHLTALPGTAALRMAGTRIGYEQSRLGGRLPARK